MNSIIKRKVFLVRIQFISPVSISSGENEWTDADVLRDFDGNPFIPGSSLAGAMRAYLNKKKTQPCLMGYSGAFSEGKMSSLYISDLNFDEKTVAGVRDGVKLNEKKVSVTEGKYDREVLEAGSKGHFYMELAVRQKDDEEQMEEELATVFRGINEGEIRLGGKKTRGFGKFAVVSLAVRTFDKNNYLEYAKAYREDAWEKRQDELDKWLQGCAFQKRMIHVEVPLRLKGGISVRQYAARKNEPDFTQLMDHGVPVIPGSSFAGAIRHRIQEILGEITANGAKLPIAVQALLDNAFGYVEGNGACVSNIIIDEAEIEEARPLTIVRTGISRFEAAVRDGALYKERTYVDGRLKLRAAVRIQKNPEDTRWMLGILLLALKDLQNGFLSVGGQTAVGRGVFEPDGELRIDGKAGIEDGIISEMFRSLV